MADPKRVDAAGSGLGNVAALLELFGGRQQTTQNTADTSALQNVLAQLQGQDPTALLNSIFAQAAGQMPGLQARFSNAVGARSGGNSAVQTALSQLLQDTVLRGQQQVAQQQAQNLQTQGQVADSIARATSGQRVQSGTNLGRAAGGLGALQAASGLWNSDAGKKVRELAGGLFSSGGGDAAANFSSALGSSMDFLGGGDAVTPLTDTAAFGSNFGDFGSAFGDVFSSDTGGSVADFFSSESGGEGSGLLDQAGDFFSGLFDGFKDGGLVGRDDDDHRKQLLQKLNANRQPQKPGGFGGADARYSGSEEKKEEKPQRGGSNLRVEEALKRSGFADGGQVSVRSGGGRRSSAPSYTPNAVVQSQAQQVPGMTLNPQILRQLLMPAQTPNEGDNTNEGNNATFGIGPLGQAASMQNNAVAEAFGKAALGQMSPVGIPGLTSSPLGLLMTMLNVGMSQQGAFDALNDAPDPIAALAAAQGWISPQAAAGVGSDNLAAAANAMSSMTQVSPMDALMQITNAFGTGPGGYGVGGNSGDSGGFGGYGTSGHSGSVSVGSIGVSDTGFGEAAADTGSFGDASDGGGTGDATSDGGNEGGVGSGTGEGGTGGGGAGYRMGGSVQGPGTGTSDSIIARLSDGEYVIPADVVDRLGVSFFDNLRAQFHTPAGK